MSARTVHDAFADRPGPWSEEEWPALPESHVRVELLVGSLLVSPTNPGGPHQRMVGNLWRLLADRAPPSDVEVFLGSNVRVRPGSVLLNERHARPIGSYERAVRSTSGWTSVPFVQPVRVTGQRCSHGTGS